MASEDRDYVPSSGSWPVDPQEDVPILKERIWVDGCFDFAHHGHAGALLQARQLGKELLVGIHTDEAILHNKGPTVMNLKERVLAVDACRWATQSIPSAPYVTSIPWISHYGCYYVVHGDDITSDSGGEDCYRFVKAAGRFLVVKRTPNISTTDLVSRILLGTKDHYINSLSQVLSGEEGSGSPEERKATGASFMERIKNYATDSSGLKAGLPLFIYQGAQKSAGALGDKQPELFSEIVTGNRPRPGQRIIYVDGGFDLFSSGHIEFLKKVVQAEHKSTGTSVENEDTDGPYIIAGVHDDSVINRHTGQNYPIMNIFERGLCVLQCRYIQCLVFSAPAAPSTEFLNSLPFGTPSAVYHGPTSSMTLPSDPYADAKAMGIYQQIGPHDFQHVNAGEIAQRIIKDRELYEERQKKKGVKAIAEEAVRNRERGQ